MTHGDVVWTMAGRGTVASVEGVWVRVRLDYGPAVTVREVWVRRLGR